MKLKKIITSILTFTVALAGIFAQQNSSDEFNRICTKLSDTRIVRGDFEQIQTVKKTGRTVKSSGKYTISAEDGIIWFTEVPVKSVMAVTKTYMIQEMNGRQRKTDGSKNPTFTNMANVISALFTGNQEEIMNSFNVECIPDSEKAYAWKIKLSPTDKTISSYIKEISLTAINPPKKKCIISEMIMVTFAGDSTTYELYNQELTDNLNSDEAKYFEK